MPEMEVYEKNEIHENQTRKKNRKIYITNLVTVISSCVLNGARAGKKFSPQLISLAQRYSARKCPRLKEKHTYVDAYKDNPRRFNAAFRSRPDTPGGIYRPVPSSRFITPFAPVTFRR